VVDKQPELLEMVAEVGMLWHRAAGVGKQPGLPAMAAEVGTLRHMAAGLGNQPKLPGSVAEDPIGHSIATVRCLYVLVAR
jgi:hypothetical protein